MDYTALFKNYIENAINNINPEYPIWNSEYIISKRKNKWNYMDGCMIYAFLELYKITENIKIVKFCEDFLSLFVENDGSIKTYNPLEYNLDNINPARNLITLYEISGDEKYRKAFENIFRNQLVSQPRTSESGNFWHKKIYSNQVWLDGTYMVFPFYAEYEVKYNSCQNIDDIVKQFTAIKQIMCDKKTGLYYHGYDESRIMNWANRITGLSPCFWLRSIGWFMSALTDTYEKLVGVSNKADILLSCILSELTESISRYVHENGMFLQIVDMPLKNGNYYETSGTLLVAYSILKAVRLGMIDKKYKSLGENAFYGVIENCIKIKSDGSFILGNICLVAGLGGEQNRNGSAEYYLSEPVVENDAKGIAPLFMAYTEILKEKGI